ncbi:MAG: glycogen synthase GlgA [Pseudomonadota bacterium]
MTRAALSVASECAPLVKTGGLADVVGALPAALAGQGWHLRTLLPGYPAVQEALGGEGDVVWQDPALFGGPARLRAGRVAGLDLLVLDAPHLFAREGAIYLGPDGRDWPDNPERFAALCWAAMRVAQGAVDGWRPEIVHAHDWQAGLLPTYLDLQGIATPTLFTVHNIAFHGFAPADRLAGLRLPAARFNPGGLEYYGQLSALKAGLLDATAISTVSPTYAAELTTPEFGMGLEGVVAGRGADLHGILNGIDTDAWSPATDPLIQRFKTPRGKAKNRKALLQEFGLTDAGGPLCVVVTRLTAQKGLDLLAEALPRLLAQGGMLALLGSGDPGLEDRFRGLAAQSGQVAAHIGYDEALSHRMFAGGDAVLVPSRFEPCGLTQMYGLRYGAVPLVARTGGLADAVIDANEAALRAGVATGIVFAPVTAAALAHAFDRLGALYADREGWARLQANAMAHPVGWDRSAASYAALYDRLTA